MTTQQKLIRSKMNLLDLGAYLGNVSEACRAQNEANRPLSPLR